MSNKGAGSPVVWIVSGPSGSGKTTLCRGLLDDPVLGPKFLRSVSYTTRPLRKGEKDGRDYHHVSETQFRALVKKQAFLEHENIFGFHYGTPKNIISLARGEHKDVLLSIDVKGARTVRRALKGRVVSIFIVAPRLGDLTKRLQQRSTENGVEMARRLRRVKMELACAADYDYIVVNDDLNKALEEIKAIIIAKKCEVK